MNITLKQLDEENLKRCEEFAFYESGLSADGCLEKLDDYARQAIERYGRLLLKRYEEKAFELGLDKIMEKYKNEFIVMQDEFRS